MKRKLSVLIMSMVLAICCTVSVFAVVAAEPTSLEVVAVNTGDPLGYGECVMIQVNKDAGGYWGAIDKTKLEYIDKYGDNVLDTVETMGNNVAVNRGKRKAAVGDVIVLQQGFEYASLTLAEEVIYQFKTAGSPWVKIAAKPTPEVKPEEPEVPDPVTVTVTNEYCFVDSTNSWNIGYVDVTFEGLKNDYALYHNIMAQNEGKYAYVNAWGETMELNDIIFTGSGHYFFRIKDKTYKSMAGDKLTIKAGFKFHDHETIGKDITFVVVKNTNEKMEEVSKVTMADSATITNTDADIDLSVEASVQMTYSVPEGTIGTPYFTSSDSTKATVTKNGLVTGVAIGEVDITAHIGDKTVVFSMNIIEKQAVTAVEFASSYNVMVLKGEKFAMPTDFKAKVKYANGNFGTPFSLVSGENLILPTVAVDTSKVGVQEIDVKIKFDNAEYAQKIKVEVYETGDFSVKEVGIVDWFMYYVFVQFPDITVNTANIQSGDLVKALKDYVQYFRADGTEVKIDAIVNLGNNLVINIFGGSLTAENYLDYYKAGDRIVLKKGLYNLLWTGDIGGAAGENKPVDGTGMVVVENILSADLEYRYDGAIWGKHVEYTGITAAKTDIEINLNKAVSGGVTRVPDNATAGTITFVSADESIATVNALGVIKGVKVGTTTITATVDGGAAGVKTITINVKVVDAKDKIIFDKTSVELKQGENFDPTTLTAKFQLVSGATGDAVDLSGATIAGLDINAEGEQTVVISVTIDGKTYSGTITVNVVKAAGCNSSIFGAMASLLALFAIIPFIIKKKKSI